MTDLPRTEPLVSPLVTAGLLLAAIDHLRRLKLPCPAVGDVLSALSVTRTQAYEYRQRLLDALPGLARPVGRPVQPSCAAALPDTKALTQEVLRYVMDHPGSVSGGDGRHRYSQGFRVFILGLRTKHNGLDLASFAEAIAVPLGTVEDWLRAPAPAPPPPSPAPDPAVTIPQIESLVDAWRRWEGSFTEFCDHARNHLRIPHGRTWIAGILAASGERKPVRREGRTSDEEALRKSFQIFFPGAQWVGDGMQVRLQINGETFTFNLELMVDAASGARVGASIRDEEDGKAVVEAFKDGVETTGAPPLATLLDNRPSNHTDEVVNELGEVIRIRASPGRGQNKGHVEGTFGLFKQVAPDLVVEATTLQHLAQQILLLVVMTWGRSTNHMPRAGRKGSKSRVDLYKGAKPTLEEVEQAKAALRERRRKQELIEERSRARLDPITREMLDRAFERLGLQDPGHHFRNAIAVYPLDAVLAGLATFEGKRDNGRLPNGVDARYLLGIVKNIAQDREGLAISEVLLRTRLEARDIALAPLERDLAFVRSSGSAVMEQIIDRAMASERRIDRLFWLGAATEEIAASPMERRADLIRQATRRIQAVYSVPYGQRLAAVRYLQEHALPVGAAA